MAIAGLSPRTTRGKYFCFCASVPRWTIAPTGPRFESTRSRPVTPQARATCSIDEDDVEERPALAPVLGGDGHAHQARLDELLDVLPGILLELVPGRPLAELVVGQRAGAVAEALCSAVRGKRMAAVSRSPSSGTADQAIHAKGSVSPGGVRRGGGSTSPRAASRASIRTGQCTRLGSASPERLAELGLQDLAGAAPGQLGPELDLPGHLEAGQPAAQVAQELVRGRAPAGLGHDHGHRDLAPALVGGRHHGALQDVGVSVERVLDLHRGDVLAPRDDDVLGAVADRMSPSASIVAMSPVWNQPSRMAWAVASGSL